MPIRRLDREIPGRSRASASKFLLAGGQDVQQAQTRKKIASESKLLDVKWDNFEDTIAVQFPSGVSAPTKCGVLDKLAKVYDPLGQASPTTLQGKRIHRVAFDCKISWNTGLRIRWQQWEQLLPAEVMTPRP